MLCLKIETNISASKSSDNPNNSRGITISGARYASEDAATLVHYVIAILEYSRLCTPLNLAKEKVETIKQEQLDFERKKLEKENEASLENFLKISFFAYSRLLSFFENSDWILFLLFSFFFVIILKENKAKKTRRKLGKTFL